MIEFKTSKTGIGFRIADYYMPNEDNFRAGAYIVDGKEYTEWSVEFRDAVTKEKMWERLQK